MEITNDRTVLTPVIHQILGLEGVVYPKPGDYAFHILVNEEERTTIPLTLELRKIAPSPSSRLLKNLPVSVSNSVGCR